MDTAKFPGKYRLKSRKRIAEVYSEGTRLFSYPFLLFYLQKDSDIFPSYAFSVSKKKFPRAVDRNRIKRLLLENIRLFHPGIKAEMKKYFYADFLVIYKGDTVISHRKMNKYWEKCMKKYIHSLSEYSD